MILNSFSRSAWLFLMEEEEPPPVMISLKFWSQEKNNGITWAVGNSGPKMARLENILSGQPISSQKMKAHDVQQKIISRAHKKKSISPS